MIQFHDIELFCLGAAAVIDTVLLFALFERRNFRRVPVPIVNLVASVWMFHCGAFVRALLFDSVGNWGERLQLFSMLVMAAGLLITPSAMLHAVWRLGHSQLKVNVKPQARFTLVYLSLFALIPVSGLLAASPGESFLTLVAPCVPYYMIWLTFVNVIAAIGFMRLRPKLSGSVQTLMSTIATLLIVITVVQVVAVLVGGQIRPAMQPWFALTAAMTPVPLVLLFAFFIIRYNFMRIVFERAMIYGAFIVGVLLFHRVILQDLWSQLSERYHVDFAILEGAVVVALILAYAPLRQRIAEALRYLLGGRVMELRENTRALALQMSNLSGRPPHDVLEWFVDTSREALGIEHVAIWLFDAKGQVTGRCGETDRLSDDGAVAFGRGLKQCDTGVCTVRDVSAGELEDLLHQADASVAVLLNHPNVSGLVVFGQRKRNEELGDEQINAIVILVEQLGITLNNSMLQADRLSAERRALQNEKLSTLGLIAGSIAHEVKNPLSSIKTIASVLAEDLGDEHKEDFELIVGEIDRLSGTVTQLLQFARPANEASSNGSTLNSIQGTLRVLGHLAKQRNVSMDVDLPETLPAISANHDMLREVIFNLISNSIDATSGGGHVGVLCRGEEGRVKIEVRDDGPGLSPEVQDRLFEPFVTTKDGGTGLGLYIVGRRVREMGGEIHCETQKGEGTVFTVILPVE